MAVWPDHPAARAFAERITRYKKRREQPFHLRPLFPFGVITVKQGLQTVLRAPIHNASGREGWDVIAVRHAIGSRSTRREQRPFSVAHGFDAYGWVAARTTDESGFEPEFQPPIGARVERDGQGHTVTAAKTPMFDCEQIASRLYSNRFISISKKVFLPPEKTAIILVCFCNDLVWFKYARP